MHAQWNDFYFLCGSSAAGLTGLMFIAITFGAELVRRNNMDRINVFFTPIAFHFFQVFLLCCVATAPTAGTHVLGWCVLLSAIFRLSRLPKAFKIIKNTADERHELELSDWLQTIVLPLIVYVSFVTNGYELLTDITCARDQFAATIILLLGTAVWAAWDMVLWLASREETKQPDPK